MVVTAGTFHGQCQQAIERHFHRLLRYCVPDISRIRYIGLICGTPQKGRGNEQVDRFLVEFIGSPPIDHFIAGNLFSHKLVKRLVLVEAANYPIAIAPFSLGKPCGSGIGIRLARIDISGRIQPVTSPPFTELRFFQELVDRPLERLVVLIFQEPFDFFLGRRKTGQVKAESSNPGAAISQG
jgi:hypothetical protein